MPVSRLPNHEHFNDLVHRITQLRVLPHSIEAESAILGRLLLDNADFDRVGDLLVAKDFYRVEHRLIYDAISTLISAGRPADAISVHDHLQSRNQETSGLTYLNALQLFVGNANAVRLHAEIVRNHAIRRQLIETCYEIAADASDPQQNTIEQIAGKLEQELARIANEIFNVKYTIHHIDGMTVDFLNRVQERAVNQFDISGVSTCYVDLDIMISGLHPGHLVVLAARPGMGKTTLAINIAANVALQGLPVAFFSTGMDDQELIQRLASYLGRIDQNHLRTGNLTAKDWPRLHEALERIRQTPFHVFHTPNLSLSELSTTARQVALQHGNLGLIVVDDIHHVVSSQHRSVETRSSEHADIPHALKMLAMKYACPIIVLSQVNRSAEQRLDKRPITGDLRGSGILERDADCILFIYRDEYYTKDACTEPGVAEIIVAKHRSGYTGTVKLFFAPKFSCFESLIGEASSNS